MTSTTAAKISTNKIRPEENKEIKLSVNSGEVKNETSLIEVKPLSNHYESKRRKSLNSNLKYLEKFVCFENYKSKKNMIILTLALILFLKTYSIGIYLQVTNLNKIINIFRTKSNNSSNQNISEISLPIENYLNNQTDYIDTDADYNYELTDIDERELANDLNEIQIEFEVCNEIQFGTFDIILHPAAAFLVILYSILIKRRVFKTKSCNGHPGVPSIISPLRKTNRIFTSIVYCAISYEVYLIVKSVIEKTSEAEKLKTSVNDPTGLFKFTIKICEVLIAALRYYPILIAYNHKSLVIYGTATIYSYFNLFISIYNTGYCQGYDFIDSKESYEIFLSTARTSLIFRAFFFIPQFFFMSLISSMMSITLILLFRKRHTSDNEIKRNETFFSIYDILYTINALNYKETLVDSNKKLSFKQKLKNFIAKNFYEWNDTYKYTSRVVSIHLTAIIVLYYTFLYYLSGIFHIIVPHLGKKFEPFHLFVPLIDELEIDLQLRKIEIKNSYIYAFVLPVVISYLICMIQLFYGLRSIKEVQLNKLFKGRSLDLKGKLEPNAASLSIGNLKFAGLLIGFLIWGFVLILNFFLLISMIFILIEAVWSWELTKKFILKIVPFIVVFIVKKIMDIMFGKYVFLQETKVDSKVVYGQILALDNSSLYSIYLYVVFFLDCFVGAVAAIVRMIKATIGAIFFMPRIGYCVLGNHLAFLDNGFQSYKGFMYFEANHANPIYLTFVALLIHKDDADEKKTLKIRFKWLIAYTLIRNPSLIGYKKKLLALNKK